MGIKQVILSLEALSAALEDDVKTSLRKAPFRRVIDLFGNPS